MKLDVFRGTVAIPFVWLGGELESCQEVADFVNVSWVVHEVPHARVWSGVGGGQADAWVAFGHLDAVKAFFAAARGGDSGAERCELGFEKPVLGFRVDFCNFRRV